jgi:hypothetical protein
MTTNRTPIQRPALTMISPRAVDLFEAMGRLRCTCPSPKPPTQGPCPGCLQWYDLHAELHDELRCEPWEWPCISRLSPKHAGSPTMSESAPALMALLKQAAKARRTESSKSNDQVVSDSSKEMPSNAESAGHTTST